MERVITRPEVQAKELTYCHRNARRGSRSDQQCVKAVQSYTDNCHSTRDSKSMPEKYTDADIKFGHKYVHQCDSLLSSPGNSLGNFQ